MLTKWGSTLTLHPRELLPLNRISLKMEGFLLDFITSKTTAGMSSRISVSKLEFIHSDGVSYCPNSDRLPGLVLAGFLVLSRKKEPETTTLLATNGTE